jgi:hypothetical protein
MQIFRKLITTLSLAVFLVVATPTASFANQDGTEPGDDISIVFDLAILRPVGLVTSVAGLLIFVGSLPISLPTLSVGKSWNALVVNPLRYTFVRKLGEENSPQ